MQWRESKMYKVDNAIIMAAGTASRFAPISYEKPKALIEVKGEILIERQIKQLLEKGINDIMIVVGYKKEMFQYLKSKFNVKLIENPDYLTRNNNASIYHARKYIKNTLICSADNYFKKNPFDIEYEESYYSGVYSNGYTNEWCMQENSDGYICKVTIGGKNSWYMLGHVFWNENFSKKFLKILEHEYNLSVTKDKLWESIFINHLDEFKMKINKYPENFIFEFDTLDELRVFDNSYILDTRSSIIKNICEKLNCNESEIINVSPIKNKDNTASGFSFTYNKNKYIYDYNNDLIKI